MYSQLRLWQRWQVMLTCVQCGVINSEERSLHLGLLEETLFIRPSCYIYTLCFLSIVTRLAKCIILCHEGRRGGQF